MLVGHLAPIGPIAAATERHWSLEWSHWTRVLPWVAATAGCIFPDLDVITNVLFNDILLHIYYLPHSVLPYSPVLVLGWLLTRRGRTRMGGLTMLAFGMGVLSHLLLDAVSHGTVLLYPVWNGLIGWTFPRTSEHMLLSYLDSPNFWLEPAVVVVALAWWLARGIHVRAIVRGKMHTA